MHDSERQDGPIRLTEADLHAPRVDDLIARQRSLRGAEGVRRNVRRAWYYQNWFVLMLVGGLAGLLSWMIVEPSLNDFYVVEGTITDSSVPFEELGDEETADMLSILGGGSHWITVDGVGAVDVLYGPDSLMQTPDGAFVPLEPERLAEGMRVRVHAEEVFMDLSEGVYGTYFELEPTDRHARDDVSIEAQSTRTMIGGLLFFGLTAAMIGLFIGAADGVICRLPTRALLCGTVGAGVGAALGVMMTFCAGLAFAAPLALLEWDGQPSTLTVSGLLLITASRGVAWMIAGIAAGLGQGIALRSGRLLVYGVIGGAAGGLLGGLVFDPVYFLLQANAPLEASLSRALGMTCVGLGVGAMIGVVELLARDAWLRMVRGPLAGKEFLLFRDVMRIGSSPRCELYLFNDDRVQPQHAVIRAAGGRYDLVRLAPEGELEINGRPTANGMLRDGDMITIGETTFVFRKSRGRKKT